jgi:hypothetical protein
VGRKGILNRKHGMKLRKRKGGSRPRALSPVNQSNNRGKLLAYIFVLILLCLAVNTTLCVLGLADSHALEEKLGAVFCGACGALITGLSRIKI